MDLKKTRLYNRLKACYFSVSKYKVFVRVYVRDAIRFYRYSSALRKPSSPENLRALIAIDHHRIEKGMAMANPKFPFGVEVVRRLLDLIEQYQSKTDDNWICQDALGSLDSYFEKHKSCDSLKDLSRKFSAMRLKLEENQKEMSATGIATKEEIIDAAQVDFEKFLHARHSVRDFASELVPAEKTRKAVRLAGRAPSVCNRQSWKVFEVRDRNIIRRLLEIQGGAKGFSDLVPSLLVITTDLRDFHGIGERRQAWVDGGIFLGLLLLALHSEGLGACPLNWCVSECVDKKAREILPILSDSKIIIALTAVGNLKSNFKYARSQRRPVEEIFEVVS